FSTRTCRQCFFGFYYPCSMPSSQLRGFRSGNHFLGRVSHTRPHFTLATLLFLPCRPELLRLTAGSRRSRSPPLNPRKELGTQPPPRRGGRSRPGWRGVLGAPVGHPTA